MAISYICDRDKAKKNVTVQIDSIKNLEKNTNKFLDNIKSINEKCRKLNKCISEIGKSNKMASISCHDLDVEEEKVGDLKDLL